MIYRVVRYSENNRIKESYQLGDFLWAIDSDHMRLFSGEVVDMELELRNGREDFQIMLRNPKTSEFCLTRQVFSTREKALKALKEMLKAIQDSLEEEVDE